MWRLWTNQSCFSLGFLSQNSLWKLFTFRGYKGLYIVGWERNVKRQFFPNKVVCRLDLVTKLSREFKPQANSLASLGLLSYSAIAGMTLQLPRILHTCANFGGLPARVTCKSSRESLHPCTILSISSHSLTHYPTWFSPKYRVTNC